MRSMVLVGMMVLCLEASAGSVDWLNESTAEYGAPSLLTALGDAQANGIETKRDEAAAVAAYRKAAEKGYTPARTMLAFAYADGRGVPKDPAQAFAWFQKAADDGDARAQYRVALAYDLGDGTKADPAAAVAWYRKAAESGDGRAQARLGELLRDGVGTLVDPVEAVRWFREAADSGIATAQLALSRAYAGGEGVKEDPGEALYWLVIGDQGSGTSPLDRAKLLLRLTEDERHKRIQSAALWEEREHCNVTPRWFCAILDGLVHSEVRARLSPLIISEASGSIVGPRLCDDCGLGIRISIAKTDKNGQPTRFAKFLSVHGLDELEGEKMLEVALVRYLRGEPLDMVKLTKAALAVLPPPPPPPPK